MYHLQIDTFDRNSHNIDYEKFVYFDDSTDMHFKYLPNDL